MSRAFIYTDNVAGLPGYTLPAALGAFAEAEVYPGARTNSAVRNFGLAGVWEASMGAKTVGRDGSGNQPHPGQILPGGHPVPPEVGQQRRSPWAATTASTRST